ncbi:hypothetical protein CHS0354_031216 [Potamilus streckersoni]|uniref:Glycoside hydrolase family 31 N-terminal domain-containing protein n=1 Tax=Potamilus streckersoni TaxID=2493646 RepID=A0AAE0TKM1_9BIVA|nr:hypothetical protein CHS0354_031216 [Potamilus streckersoni]
MDYNYAYPDRFIYDPNVKRYEVPLETPDVDDQAPHPVYDVAFKNSPFGILVIRKSTGTILFDSSYVPLTFADQYIEITTSLPTKYIYGLGERRHQLWLNPENSARFPLWTRDQGLPTDTNLYGVHPFYLGMEEDGNAFGVFLLNSNAMGRT